MVTNRIGYEQNWLQTELGTNRIVNCTKHIVWIKLHKLNFTKQIAQSILWKSCIDQIAQSTLCGDIPFIGFKIKARVLSIGLRYMTNSWILYIQHVLICRFAQTYIHNTHLSCLIISALHNPCQCESYNNLPIKKVLNRRNLKIIS